MKDLQSVNKIAFEVSVALENATYQAFINASSEMIAPEDFYTLDQMKDEYRLRKNRICVRNLNGKLAYSLMTPFDNRLVVDYPTNIDYPVDLFTDKWSKQKTERLRRDVVAQAISDGHNLGAWYQDPFEGYLDELSDHLSDQDYNEELFATIYRNAFLVGVNAETAKCSRVEFTYKRSVGTAEPISLSLWINRHVVAQYLNKSYATTYDPDNTGHDYYSQYLVQSMLPDPNISVFGNVRETRGFQKYRDMALTLTVKKFTASQSSNQSSPFVLDLLKTILSMYVIPVIGVLAIVSFITTGTAMYGLAGGLLYGAAVLVAKPCYHRFFGESQQPRALSQQRVSEPVDITQLFQNHFSSAQHVDLLRPEIS